MNRKIASAVLALVFVSCGGTTGGSLLQIPFLAGGADRAGPADAPFNFTTPPVGNAQLTWNVTLTQARIAAGPLYFNVAPPPTDAFRGGTVIMEVTAQVVVDPLDPSLHAVAAGADGETGTAVSVEIDLFPPDTTQSAANSALLTTGDPGDEPSQVYVQGTATSGALTVPFAGWVTIDQSLATTNRPLPYLQRIAGAACDLNFASNQQSLSFRVDPTHWFDQTDFSVFTKTPLDAAEYSVNNGVYTWAKNSEFHAQLLQGVWASAGVYLFALMQ